MRRRQDSSGTVITSNSSSVVASVPVTHGNSVQCALELSYYESDPLVVHVRLRAPSGSCVVERMMLRKDLRACLFTNVGQHDMVAGPTETKSAIQLIFREGRVAIGVLVPVPTIEGLLEVAGSIVAFTEQAEAIALGRAFEELTRR